ncbi:MAG: IMP dehydrogenase, partial [Candidatus Hodarchaeota archaeon]
MFLDKFTNAEEVFTFSDMILLPGKTSIAPWEPDVQTQITNNWRINIPLVSSPMDTVTETQMAISLARCGGMGVLHRNCSIEDHVEMARQVKRAESFIIRDVITTTPDTTVKELKEAIDQYKISGFPVVDKAG